MKADIYMLSKTRNLVEQALGSILRNAKPESIGEIAVGWNGEWNQEFIGWTKQFDIADFETRWVRLCEYNFAMNNNFLAANYGKSEAVLFMNDDVVLMDDGVTGCLKLLECEDVGTVGIKLLYPDKTIQHAGIVVLFNQDGTFKGVTHVGWKHPDMRLPPSMVHGSTGAFLMMRRRDFEEAGGFNEGYVHCFEDVELNLRVMLKGLTNICNNPSWAWHRESATRHQSFCGEDAYRLAEFVNGNAVRIREAMKR